jgi:hypothetical protein
MGKESTRAGLLVSGLNRLRSLVLGRWIAAGSGCDCDLVAEASSTIGTLENTKSHLSHD